MSRKSKKQNYLEFIPVKNPEVEFKTNEDGVIVLFKEWTGFYHKIAQKFFHRPRVSQIKMDEYGSFVWNEIDGEKNVYDVALTTEKAYPDMEKALERVIKFLEILRDNGFITWNEEAES